MTYERGITPVRLAGLAVSAALFLAGLMSGVGAWQDGRAYASAHPCTPPVTSNKACVYEIPARIAARRAEQTGGTPVQVIEIELETGQRHQAWVYRMEHELLPGDQVTAKVWDGQVVRVVWADQEAVTDWNSASMLIVLMIGWPALGILSYVVILMTRGATGGPTSFLFITSGAIAIFPIALGHWLVTLSLAVLVVAADFVLEPRAAARQRRSDAVRLR